MASQFLIADMHRSDWPTVRGIYGEGLSTGLAAFISVPPRWESWHESHLAVGRLVARDGERVVGWAALSRAADT